VLHLYGIVQDLDELPEAAGVDGAPLERRRVNGFELIVSRVGDRAAVSQEAVLRHADVVEALMGRGGAVLPAQFGAAFADEAELVGAVTERSSELERGLARVRGCVEFGLRVLGASDAGTETAPASGTDYMEARLAQVKQRQRLAAQVHGPLARIARSARVFDDRPGSLLEAAYLVPEEAVARFRLHLLRLERAHPELNIICTGPWPPYSFAAEHEGDA
jgi:hypothetical protein